MSENDEDVLKPEEKNLNYLERNLADILTLTRIIIGLIILSFSFMGENAYIAVVIFTFVGAATDILDGKAARHYSREGRLGKHDHEVDTFFVLCVMGYLSLTRIIIQPVLGFGWIGFVLITYIFSKRDLRVQIISEIATVIALLVISLFYNPLLFWLIIAPSLATGIVVNRKRVLYLTFDYWPSIFSK